MNNVRKTIYHLPHEWKVTVLTEVTMEERMIDWSFVFKADSDMVWPDIRSLAVEIMRKFYGPVGWKIKSISLGE